MTDETYDKIKDFARRYTIASNLFGNLGAADLVVTEGVEVDAPELIRSPPTVRLHPEDYRDLLARTAKRPSTSERLT